MLVESMTCQGHHIGGMNDLLGHRDGGMNDLFWTPCWWNE